MGFLVQNWSRSGQPSGRGGILSYSDLLPLAWVGILDKSDKSDILAQEVEKVRKVTLLLLFGDSGDSLSDSGGVLDYSDPIPP